MKTKNLQIGDQVSLFGKDFKEIVSINRFVGKIDFKLKGERTKHRYHKESDLVVLCNRPIAGSGFAK